MNGGILLKFAQSRKSELSVQSIIICVCLRVPINCYLNIDYDKHSGHRSPCAISNQQVKSSVYLQFKLTFKITTN